MESLKNKNFKFNDSMVCVWQYDYECFKLSKYLENPHAFVFKIYPKMESLKFQYWGLNEISFYLFIYLFFFCNYIYALVH